MPKPNDLAQAHWNYIEDLLKTHGVSVDIINLIKFHYITAFIHGYKHAKEEFQNGLRKEN